MAAEPAVGLAAVAARLEALAALEEPPATDDLSAGADRADPELRLALVGDRLGLSPLERAVLAALLLPETSPAHALLLAKLGGHPDAPTARAVARALAGPGVTAGDVLAVLDADGALRRLRLVLPVDPDGPGGLADRPLEVAPRLAELVLGTALTEPTLGGRLRRLGAVTLPLGREAVVARLAGLLAVRGRPAVVVQGDDALAAVLAAAPRGALAVRAAEALEPGVRDAALVAAALEGRVLVVDGVDLVGEDRIAELPGAIDALPDAVVLATSPGELAALDRTATIVLAVAPPTASERRAAWRAAIESDVAHDVAERYRLPVGRIAQAAWTAATLAQAEGRDAVGPDDCERGARLASAARIGELARRVATDLGWDDLVLPDRQLGQLRGLSAYLRHRDLVLGTWGFGRRSGRSQGLIAMFCGESGTGKTLAARVLAADLGLELFRIDLASVVSKWLGETERNLDRVFAAAQGANAVLFFDEADAVFGKRSDVSSSHDRYANLETAYLLQRIEGHDGPVVLATNLRGNVDDAFLRRMDAVIELPFPDVRDRRRLWDLLLPAEAPRGPDVDLDFLAERFDLAGGGIRNAALTGAVLAADDGGPIGMAHLVRGVALEYAKLGRLTLAADFERFHDLVRVPGGAP